MGIKGFIHSTMNTLKMARKSDREEFMLYLKLVLLGIGIVGAIGYLIQFVGSLLKIAG